MRTVIALTMSVALLNGLLAQDAKAFLKQVQQKYRQMKSMEASITINAEIQRDSSSIKQQVHSSVAMVKPNKVALKASGDDPMASREIYSDGKQIIIYLPAMKSYVKREAPPNFEGPAAAATLGEIGMLFSLAEENLDDPNSKAKYAFKGKKTINGKPTRIVEISEKRQNASVLLRLYVGEQDKLIYRLEMNQSFQQAVQQGQPPQQFSLKASADIRYKSVNKPIPASRFKFTPPKDAKPMQMPQPGTPAPPPQGP